MPPYVMIDGAPVSTYFLTALAGIVFVIIIGLVKHKALSLRKRDILRLVAYAVIGAYWGAKLFGVIGFIFKHGSEPNFWTADTWQRIARAGGVFYGGLLGAIGLSALRAKIGRIDLNSMFNFAAYAAFAFQSLGRLGCYCAGCCYGVILANGTQFPVQLFEAGFCFVALLIFLVAKPERRWPGIPLFPVYLITYSAGRFILEFFRGDANRGVWILSTSQWIALVLITVAVVWLRKSKSIQQTKKNNPSPARKREPAMRR